MKTSGLSARTERFIESLERICDRFRRPLHIKRNKENILILFPKYIIVYPKEKYLSIQPTVHNATNESQFNVQKWKLLSAKKKTANIASDIFGVLILWKWGGFVLARQAHHWSNTTLNLLLSILHIQVQILEMKSFIESTTSHYHLASETT